MIKSGLDGKRVSASRSTSEDRVGDPSTLRMVPQNYSINKRVLVVDDEEEATDALQSALMHSGFAVDVYNDPKDAVASFEEGMYDLVLLDIRIPKMNGFQVYREMRKRDVDVKVWFLTTFEIRMSEFSKVFPETDVQELIQKPITVPDLMRKVEKLVMQPLQEGVVAGITSGRRHSELGPGMPARNLFP